MRVHPPAVARLQHRSQARHRRAPAVATETTALKRAWVKLGCKVPYMGFNLLPLSVIPELRLTDKGLVDVLGMKVVRLFE